MASIMSLYFESLTKPYNNMPYKSHKIVVILLKLLIVCAVSSVTSIGVHSSSARAFIDLISLYSV